MFDRLIIGGNKDENQRIFQFTVTDLRDKILVPLLIIIIIAITVNDLFFISVMKEVLVMVVYCVNVFVKPGKEDVFLEATKENHLATRHEPGNIRFDVLQCNDEQSKYFLYEVYQSPEAVKAHKQTPHYKKWRETVADWMAKPREGVQYTPRFPEDVSAW
ncbi:MAG: putative quinol monooxygenase [Spirochaetia bacterium]